MSARLEFSHLHHGLLEVMINDLVYSLYRISEDERVAIQRELSAVSGMDGNVDLSQEELESEG
jgi:hypothetical protein